MNPEYKEISYHQLMKKIEVLNELNTDQKWFYNKLSEAGGAFGSAEKDRKVAEARARFQAIHDNPATSDSQLRTAQSKLNDEIEAITSSSLGMDDSEESETPPSTSEATTPPSGGTTPPSGGTGALGAKKTSIWKKIGNTLASTARSGLRSTQLGSAIEKNFLKPEKNRSSGSRGSASDCNSIKLNSAGLGKVKQNQILKAAGCDEIP